MYKFKKKKNQSIHKSCFWEPQETLHATEWHQYVGSSDKRQNRKNNSQYSIQLINEEIAYLAMRATWRPLSRL